MNLEHSSNWIVISGFILAMIIMASWGIDMAIAALSNGGILTNGFFLSDPLKVYHLCLYLIIILSFSNFIIIVHIILRSHDEISIKQKLIFDENEEKISVEDIHIKES